MGNTKTLTVNTMRKQTEAAGIRAGELSMVARGVKLISLKIKAVSASFGPDVDCPAEMYLTLHFSPHPMEPLHFTVC